MKDILRIVSHLPLDNELPGDMPIPTVESSPPAGDVGSDGGGDSGAGGNTDGDVNGDGGGGGGEDAGDMDGTGEGGGDDPSVDSDEGGEGSEDGFSYFLYTNTSQLEEDVLLTPSTLSLLNNSNPIKFIVHGWISNFKGEWETKLIEAYLSRGNCNVVGVDWSRVAAEPYFTAVFGAKEAGEKIGKMIADIIETYPEKSMGNYHIIGHSLGAHVAGFAGRTVSSITGNKIGRITALDPAGPLFDLSFTDAIEKLSAEDAEFVDVLHTDGGVFGYKEKIGTVDFYANGGSAQQPGCAYNGYDTLVEDLFCSHHRSFRYFIESINSDKILAQECDSASTFDLGLCSDYDKIIFGEDVPQNASGNFFFFTNSEPPYAKTEEEDNTVDEPEIEGGGEDEGAGDESSGGTGEGGLPDASGIASTVADAASQVPDVQDVIEEGAKVPRVSVGAPSVSDVAGAVSGIPAVSDGMQSVQDAAENGVASASDMADGIPSVPGGMPNIPGLDGGMATVAGMDAMNSNLGMDGGNKLTAIGPPPLQTFDVFLRRLGLNSSFYQNAT